MGARRQGAKTRWPAADAMDVNNKRDAAQNHQFMSNLFCYISRQGKAWVQRLAARRR